MGLTFVPTPLGNLRDITLRALDVLRDCDLLVAEDTRVARKLLSALGLPGKPIWSYREQNAQGATEGILERARLERVAVVSDAGTPGISDPGSALVAAARAAGVTVEVLPGACAFVTAAVLSGFDIRRMRFEGFVPRATGDRIRNFHAALDSGSAVAYYESPNRIVATLQTLNDIAPDAKIFLVRELSKKFEQQLSGTPLVVATALERPVRGEIAIVLAPRVPEATNFGATELDAAIASELRLDATPAAIAKNLAARGFGERSTIYDRISAIRAGERD